MYIIQLKRIYYFVFLPIILIGLWCATAIRKDASKSRHPIILILSNGWPFPPLAPLTVINLVWNSIYYYNAQRAMVREVCAAAAVAVAAAAAYVVRSSQPVSNTPVSITLPSRSPWRSPVRVRSGHFFSLIAVCRLSFFCLCTILCIHKYVYDRNICWRWHLRTSR